MAASQTFSGSRAIFSINGAAVGYAAGVSGEEMIDYEPVDVLQVLEVKEYVPVAYRCSLTAQIFRVVGSSLKKNKIFPNQTDILTSNDLEASITDVINPGAALAFFSGVKCSGHSFDVTARGIVQENVTFVAIKVRDESEG